jgi:PAS domain S-box-containing protein
MSSAAPAAPTVAPSRARAFGDASFRLLVESVRDYAIYIVDPDGLVATWNAGAQNLYGYRAEEILGRHLSCFYDAADAAERRWERDLETAAREGRVGGEAHRVRKDGTRFWADVVTAALRDGGELIGFARITRDLTARRAAEEERVRLAHAEESRRLEQRTRRAAEEARRWLEITLRSIGDGVITTDADGRVTLMNPVAEALTGYASPDAVGKHLDEVFHIVNEVTRARIAHPAARVLDGGAVSALSNHSVLVRPDGSETPIADSGAPICDERGAVRGVVIVFRDATPERDAAARRSFMVEATAVLGSSLDPKRTFERLAELAVPRLADWCAVHVLSADGVPEQVAAAHVDPEKVVLARKMGERFPPRPDAPHGIAEVIRTGRAVLRRHFDDAALAEVSQSAEQLAFLRQLQLGSLVIVPITTGTRVLGTVTFVYAESGRLYDEDALAFAEELGRRAGMAVENARLYSAEQRAREAADTANRAKDEFLAAVSHELRTPLTAIVGWSKLLGLGRLDDAERGRAIDAIQRNSLTMTQLIEDLLDVSRIVSGKLRIDMRPVAIGPVVEAAIDSMQHVADAKSVVVARAVEPDLPSVLGDAGRLQQVVWNLVHNAVKFSPRGGRVFVSARAADSTIEIEVADEGRGIPARFLPHVFDPFRQAEGGIARAAGGLGLGLAISKRLVDLHGGSITAASEGEGKGATLTVRLPLIAAPAVAGERPGSAPGAGASTRPAQKLRGVRVLVVDDEEDARVLMRVILEQSGAVVTTASSVDEALAAMRAEVPDVLVSDIGMPGQTGYDLIRRVRALAPAAGGNVPAAALTAYARPEDRHKALAAGFEMHIPKPIDPDELVAVIGAVARSKISSAE